MKDRTKEVGELLVKGIKKGIEETSKEFQKDEIKEIGKLYTKGLKKGMDEVTIEMQQKRIKKLEQINEEHRELNGELHNTINKAIEYMNNYNELVVPDANIKSLILKEEYKKIINLLQGKSDE